MNPVSNNFDSADQIAENDNALGSVESFVHENSISVPQDPLQSKAFIDDLAEIAFEHIYSNLASKSNSFSLFEKIVSLYSERLPSPEEMRFAQEVFKNEYRIRNFFSAKFDTLKILEKQISDSSVLFFIDPYSFFEQLLSNAEIRSSLEFQVSSNSVFSSHHN